MPNIDWITIKNEYINTNTSYRKLADKYGVSVTAIANKAKSENWVNAKDEQRNKTYIEIVQKTADKIVESEVDRLTKVLELSDDIVPKIKKAIEQLEADAENSEGGMVDTYRLRQIVQSIKDLKEIVKNDIKEDEFTSRHQQEAHKELIEAIRKSHNENTKVVRKTRADI